MNYRYPRHRIQELVQAPKRLRDGRPLELERRGEQSQVFDAEAELLDGPFCDLRYLGKAGRVDRPESYDASLLLDQQRVRGIGFNPVGRENFRQRRSIPQGWHQNVCDPNVPTDHPDWNWHQPLADFAPADFRDFVRRAARLWSIDLGEEGELL